MSNKSRQRQREREMKSTVNSSDRENKIMILRTIGFHMYEKFESNTLDTIKEKGSCGISTTTYDIMEMMSNEIRTRSLRDTLSPLGIPVKNLTKYDIVNFQKEFECYTKLFIDLNPQYILKKITWTKSYFDRVNNDKIIGTEVVTDPSTINFNDPRVDYKFYPKVVPTDPYRN